MKIKLKNLLICAELASTYLLFSSQSSVKPNTPPNIIIILTDDMGYGDVSTFGGKFVKTPNIDRIASKGLKFTQYYCGAPICSPSRARSRAYRYQLDLV
ncbi:sulfatase-like hydrolase/transferase [Pedobacter sp. JCM 36344]|uniref:sulfatase-like hydrolase/transferase n=1 Tax=Pedobacter sp. JCM 36344 TaxID=3374280 RepID=UPI00397936ED